jgi:hypothetical protein
VHAIAGSVLHYRHFVRLLPDWVTVYGISYSRRWWRWSSSSSQTKKKKKTLTSLAQHYLQLVGAYGFGIFRKATAKLRIIVLKNDPPIAWSWLVLGAAPEFRFQKPIEKFCAFI